MGPNKQCNFGLRRGDTEVRRCGIGWDGMLHPPPGYRYPYGEWGMGDGTRMAGEAPAGLRRRLYCLGEGEGLISIATLVV